MKIVFMGSPDFAVPSLVALHQSNHDVMAVISGDDKVRGRRSKPTPTPVKAKALELGIPAFSFEKMKDPELEKTIKNLQPDLIVIVAFKILPKTIIDIPKYGAVNIHASLLPKYRGAAPIHWAVVNGEKETGVTVFFLNEGIDEGNIILQKKIEIESFENTGEVYQHLMDLGANSIVQAVDSIQENSYTLLTQDDSLATAAPKIFKEDAKIDFNQKGDIIHNRIRGMNPFPGSWILLDDKITKIKKAYFSNDFRLEVNKIELIDKRLMVGCLDGVIIIEEIQLQGKAATDGISFWNGYRGDRLIS